jgi:hypothetical protein
METGVRISYDRDRVEGRGTEGGLILRRLVLHDPEFGSLHVDETLEKEKMVIIVNFTKL